MREFNYEKYKDYMWDREVLGYIASIYKLAGKEELYIKEKPLELEKLINIAKVQSTLSSNAIEGIVTTSTRLNMLMNEKTSPKNRDENEIVGYRDALNTIHENYENIDITKNYILQIHKIMLSYTNDTMAGKTKNVQNYISVSYSNGTNEIIFTPLSPVETPDALDKICKEFNLAVSKNYCDPLLLIPIFIHDFLCIHPFNDGNGRMSRLLTTLLLYKCGFNIGKYISLESKIANNKDNYYKSLRKSQVMWHEGNDDIIPFVKYILSTILEAYKDFEDRYEVLDGSTFAVDKVRKVIEGKIGKFTKKDILNECPSISISSCEGTLRELVRLKEIKKEGKGKSTYYIRLK